MKKPVIIVAIIAVALLLLVACVSPPPPLSEESTEASTADVTTVWCPSFGGDSTTSATTTEAQTMEETTVAGETTQGERYGYPLLPIPEPRPAVTGTVQIEDAELPWEFTEWTPRKELVPVDLPEELQSLAFRMPETYEIELEGIRYKYEFFHEYYLLKNQIRVRLTIENKTDQLAAINYLYNHTFAAIVKEKVGETPHWSFAAEETDDYYTNRWPGMNAANPLGKMYKVYICPTGVDAEVVKQRMKDDERLGAYDQVKSEKIVLECLLEVNPKSIYTDGKYTYAFASHVAFFLGSIDSKEYNFEFDGVLWIPIELVSVEVVKAERVSAE